MNSIVIILGIVIVILIYVLYKYFTNRSSTLQAQASLTTVLPQITSVQSPTNTRYAYGIWVYVNSWDPNVNKTIFSRNGNMKVYLDRYSPTLLVDVTMTDNSVQKMVMTDNFPIQKWVQIIVSVDNQFVDGYLDGKLVKSQRFYLAASAANSSVLMPKTPPDVSTPIFLGNSDVSAAGFTSFDTYIAKFKRWTNPIDPQTAWSSYLEGNGSNAMSNAVSSYGINMAVLKDNVEQSKYILF